jgi:serine protease
VTPTSLGFGATLSAATLQVENAGGGTLQINSVTEGSGWLSVSPDSVDGDGLGTYSVTVDRTGLTAGTYNATIMVNATTGTQNVPVSMSVASTAAGAGLPGGFEGYELLRPKPPSE